MSELLTILFQLLIMVIIIAIGIAIKQYVIPWIKKRTEEKNIQISQAEWDLAESIIITLVTSAFRLKDTGKITDAKDYVMTLAKEQLSQVGINLSDEMIDEIRRAAVLEWESSIKQLENEIVLRKEENPGLNEGEIEAKTVKL